MKCTHCNADTQDLSFITVQLSSENIHKSSVLRKAIPLCPTCVKSFLQSTVNKVSISLERKLIQKIGTFWE